jgi:hypothetical protein
VVAVGNYKSGVAFKRFTLDDVADEVHGGGVGGAKRQKAVKKSQ